MVHALKLVGLSETVPGPKIFLINVYSIPIGFYGTGYVFHL